MSRFDEREGFAADRLPGCEAERAEVRRGYLPEVAKIPPGRTVARFYPGRAFGAVKSFALGRGQIMCSRHVATCWLTGR